jgi:hypothetical protein
MVLIFKLEVLATRSSIFKQDMAQEEHLELTLEHLISGTWELIIGHHRPHTSGGIVRAEKMETMEVTKITIVV